MDFVSAVANFIALMQISTKLVTLRRSCFSKMKEAKRDIQQFCNKGTTLNNIWINLEDLMKTLNGTKPTILDMSLK